MEFEEKKSKKGVWIVILILIILGLGGYIYYTDYYNPKVKTVTKTKTVTKSEITEQVAKALARETYNDYSTITTKFDVEEAADESASAKITNYADITEKYFTEEGITVFEEIAKTAGYLTEENTEWYFVSSKISDCTTESQEYTIDDYNPSEISYTVDEKQQCKLDTTETEDSTKTTKITLKYEKKYWKINSIE